jgi:hypothetical protein
MNRSLAPSTHGMHRSACTARWERRRHSLLGSLAPGLEQREQLLPGRVPWVFRRAAREIADRRLTTVAVRCDLGLGHAVLLDQLRDEN